MISIELISKGEFYLKETLESIRKQNINNFEVVCTDSSGKNEIKDLLENYGCKVVEASVETGHLNARYLSHLHSKGQWCLLLDSTRPLKNNALSILMENYSKYDMTIIREDSIGTGFWVEQARRLSDISTPQFHRLNNETLAFLLPRLYRRNLLDSSFSRIKEISKDLFNRISYGEHHLIFEGARKFSKNIGLTDEKLISHFEDDSLLKIFRKYHWYGKSQKTLRLLENSETRYFLTHTRRKVPFLKRIGTLPISSARMLPFLIGYFLF